MRRIWLNNFAKEDYQAAQNYLSLIYINKRSAQYIQRIEHTKVSKYRAEDILRASGLPLLPANDKCVKKNRKKIASQKKLSPILLIRDTDGGKVVIADGYHRMCAVYYDDAEELIPCKII